MKRIKFNALNDAQKKAIQVLFIDKKDVVREIYLKMVNLDMFRASHDTLSALGYYGISYFVRDSYGDYTIKVVL